MADTSVESLYGYIPSKAACYAFIVLYAISTLLHTFQAAKSRTWWIFPTVVVAGIAEVVGWVARLISSGDITSRNAYIVQTTVLVLAPTPFLAALFIGFGRISARVGAQYSRLSPAWYSRVFLAGDILSLFIQGGGGGIAASPSASPDKRRLGSNIILAGLGIQLFSMSMFCVLMAEYAWRRTTDRPYRKPAPGQPAENLPMTRHMKFLIIGICLSAFFIYVRSIYRVIEFADGFSGSIAHTQQLFNVFDGVMVTLAMWSLNIFNPGLLLQWSAQTQSVAVEENKHY